MIAILGYVYNHTVKSNLLSITAQLKENPELRDNLKRHLNHMLSQPIESYVGENQQRIFLLLKLFCNDSEVMSVIKIKSEEIRKVFNVDQISALTSEEDQQLGIIIEADLATQH